MSASNYYFGDSVSMHGGQHNRGIVKQQLPSDADTLSPPVLEALHELLRLLTELRDRVSTPSARAIDDVLPSIGTDGDIQPQERYRALMMISGIATTVGAIGQPVLDAVNKVLELVGAR
ncbi:MULTISPECIES: hypothetical protein [unclassified Streptomyces]|uniref:hypothetical protein n=1 Tax=unclassified Streptomyces TaxID=2593676 RepID=UPI000DAE38AB|nr:MULTISPECIES: hypothetical protein [unclassified Streptomyces]PZT77379.1 hypothetical protein DNK56_29740 [Streptomyces sp. AC1-42W]PZT78666.1 hypothetical protein DNK55_02940 [Streptomyces sp. AC1-42T]